MAAWRFVGWLAHWTVVLGVAVAVWTWNAFRALSPRAQKRFLIGAGCAVALITLLGAAVDDPVEQEARLSADVADRLPRATTTTSKRIIEKRSEPVEEVTTTSIEATTTVPTTVPPTTAPKVTTTIAAAVVTTAAPPATARPTTTTTVRQTTTTAAAAASSSSGCHSSYRGTCIPPDVSDADCYPGKGDGPHYVHENNIQVVGPDEFGLDSDNDGIGCEEP